jgi:predicted nucleic acid-binding protein
MILADTSVWIEYFRHGKIGLGERLVEGQILIHPFVFGELACGSLNNRAAFLARLNALPAARPASQAEVLTLIEEHRLWGLGLNWIDIHLLASALLSDCRFWTLDKRLALAAKRLGVS